MRGGRFAYINTEWSGVWLARAGNFGYPGHKLHISDFRLTGGGALCRMCGVGGFPPRADLRFGSRY